MYKEKALSLEQLRGMDGKPAYWPEVESWGIISVEGAGKWAGIPFFCGRKLGVNFQYNIESRGMEVYASPPAHIGRGIWVNASERMPEDGQIVLVTASGKPQSNITLEYAYELAEWSIEKGWILNCWPEWERAKVTHWMPLPEPPTELEKRLRG